MSEDGVEIDAETLEMERGTSLVDRSERVTGRESSKEEKLGFMETIKLRISIIEDMIQNEKNVKLCE